MNDPMPRLESMLERMLMRHAVDIEREIIDSIVRESMQAKDMVQFDSFALHKVYELIALRKVILNIKSAVATSE